MGKVSAPANVILELTRHCNLKCFYCKKSRNNNSPKPSFFEVKHFKKIIDCLFEARVFQLTFSGGEPFLYPGIFELGHYARENDLTVSFLSNGTLIEEKHIGEITRVFNGGCTIAQWFGAVPRQIRPKKRHVQTHNKRY